jgi:hypothetical protein
VPGCVLRVYGAEFDVDGYLATSRFTPCAVYHRGQPRTSVSKRISESSGFNLDVSDVGGDEVPVQVREAASFVTGHREELARLREWHGVEQLTLDFGWDFPYERTLGQWNYFPPEFLRDCGELGIGIVVSVYASS